MNQPIPLDDLEAQARMAWRIASEICSCEGDYHRVHPVLRAIGSMKGIAADHDVLGGILSDLVRPDARILIAGAADATLVQYFVAHSDARPLSISVVDLCEAPLRLIEHLELPSEVQVDTRQIDLTMLEDKDRYDLILSHSMLPFVDDAARVEVLRRLGDSLTPDGRIILVLRVTQSTYQATDEELTDALLRRNESRLGNCPDLIDFCGNELPAALRNNAAAFAARKGGFRDEDDIRSVIDRAGLRVVQHARSGDTVKTIMPDGSERARLGHVFVLART